MWKRYCLSLFHIFFMYSFIFSLFVGNRFIQLTLISAYAGKLLCCVEELDAIRSSQQERWSPAGRCSWLLSVSLVHLIRVCLR